MNILIKLVLTALLVWWVALPLVEQSPGNNVLSEILATGIVESILIIAAFFIMVAFYCRTLQKCFSLIQPQNRKAQPHSVWYMFALPFNFIEDFFIVINLANSIEAEKKTNQKLDHVKDNGMVTGISWSIAQLMSFIPNIVGQTAGLLGMLLVIVHWIQVAKINRILGSSSVTKTS